MASRPPETVTAELGTFVHAERTSGEDHAIVTVRFEGNRVGLIETSWAKRGGMDDRAEILGSRGSHLRRPDARLALSPTATRLRLCRREGAGHPGLDVHHVRGAVALRHSAGDAPLRQCVQHSGQPLETGEDGRAVLEILYGMYRAAGDGGRVRLPLDLDDHERRAAPAAAWLEQTAITRG